MTHLIKVNRSIFCVDTFINTNELYLWITYTIHIFIRLTCSTENNWLFEVPKYNYIGTCMYYLEVKLHSAFDSIWTNFDNDYSIKDYRCKIELWPCHCRQHETSITSSGNWCMINKFACYLKLYGISCMWHSIIDQAKIQLCLTLYILIILSYSFYINGESMILNQVNVKPFEIPNRGLYYSRQCKVNIQTAKNQFNWGQSIINHNQSIQILFNKQSINKNIGHYGDCMYWIPITPPPLDDQTLVLSVFKENKITGNLQCRRKWIFAGTISDCTDCFSDFWFVNGFRQCLEYSDWLTSYWIPPRYQTNLCLPVPLMGIHIGQVNSPELRCN